MAKNPWEFLDGWANENVHATVYDDNATAEQLAFDCRQAAKDAGVNEAGVVKAAGGNLKSFMLNRLNEAVNREVDRQVARDKS
ncbi:hypothetical protein WI560_32015 [Bradyrhizobium sp. A11]|uniref:hypothetical protein n=1 Tax=Bradyrhizobium sp. A11 TaxID=3133974 RepID=UPI0032471617